jgi:hypothetical protein
MSKMIRGRRVTHHLIEYRIDDGPWWTLSDRWILFTQRRFVRAIHREKPGTTVYTRGRTYSDDAAM